MILLPSNLGRLSVGMAIVENRRGGAEAEARRRGRNAARTCGWVDGWMHALPSHETTNKNQETDTLFIVQQHIMMFLDLRVGFRNRRYFFQQFVFSLIFFV